MLSGANLFHLPLLLYTMKHIKYHGYFIFPELSLRYTMVQLVPASLSLSHYLTVKKKGVFAVEPGQ